MRATYFTRLDTGRAWHKFGISLSDTASTPVHFNNRRTMANQTQSFANHAKFDPAFHFFVLPVLLINIFVVGYLLFRHPGMGGAWLLLLSVTLFVLAGRTRSYATHLQDRVIRLEERLRLASILPEPLRSRIAELSDSQIVGL